jgi:hypothetical protein
MNRYVILNSENKIHNIVIWNGDLSVWHPPQNTRAVLIDEINIHEYEWQTEEEAASIILGANQ